MTAKRVLAISVAALGCVACQYSPNMLERTVAYNRAVADSTNQVLLLNIVRASERLPTYYTRLEGDSSTLGLTPNATLTTPLANGHTFETDTNNSAAGAITSSATKAVTSLAALAGGLGVQANESNLLSLQTLDDQKYQNGMMTPVPLKNIQILQEEGYSRDLLFMMFVASVQISNRLIDPIETAVTTRCTQLRRNTGRAEGISFAHQICDYIATKPYQALFDPSGGQPADYSFSLKTCLNTGGAMRDDPLDEMVHFNNDPSRGGRRDNASDPHPGVCFQILLDDLLILGLKVGSAQDVPADVVDVVSDSVANDPKFRAQILQQNMFFRQAADGLTVICRKKTQDNGFTLSFNNPNLRNQLVDVPNSDANATASRPRASSAAATGSYPSDPTAACQQKKPGAPENAEQRALASSDDDTLPTNANQPQPMKLPADKVSFSTRSFEGMIYYLGEITRHEEDKDAEPLTFPRVLGRNPLLSGEGYYEIMFYGSSHLPKEDAAVSVRDDNGSLFAIPKPCMTSSLSQSSGRIACSSEYPDNESLPLMNFVNQIWGLQKESGSGPSSPLVVVSPQ